MQLVFSLAIATASYLIKRFMTPDIVNEGPRVKNLEIMDSGYGKMIPWLWGTCKVPGNVDWSTDLQETKHEEEMGGKGGGPSNTSVTYTYSASFGVSLIAAYEPATTTVLKVWANTKLIYDVTDTNETAVKIEGLNMHIYSGAADQDVDPVEEADVGVGDTPAHRGKLRIVFHDLQLEDYGNRLPDITALVSTNVTQVPVSSTTIDYDQWDVTNIYEMLNDYSQPYIYVECDQGFAKAATIGDEIVSIGYPNGSWTIVDWDIDRAGRIWCIDSDVPALMKIDSNTMTGTSQEITETFEDYTTGASKIWERICCTSEYVLLSVSSVRAPDYPATGACACIAVLSITSMAELYRAYIEGASVADGQAWVAPSFELAETILVSDTEDKLYVIMKNDCKIVKIDPLAWSHMEYDLEAECGAAEFSSVFWASANDSDVLFIILSDDTGGLWQVGDPSIGSPISVGSRVLSRWVFNDRYLWSQLTTYVPVKTDLVEGETVDSVADYFNDWLETYDPVTQTLYGAPDPPAISGPTTVTKPGGYQYTGSEGVLPYVWSVSGTGVTISQTGYVTLGGDACGAYTVTLLDQCGDTAELTARITNDGGWTLEEYNQPCTVSGSCGSTGCNYTVIEDDLKWEYAGNLVNMASDCDSVDPPCGWIEWDEFGVLKCVAVAYSKWRYTC